MERIFQKYNLQTGEWVNCGLSEEDWRSYSMRNNDNFRN